MYTYVYVVSYSHQAKLSLFHFCFIETLTK